MTPAERKRVVDSLPGEVTWDEMAMPEGDRHSWPKLQAFGALKSYFAHQRRRVYLAMELPVYYPAQRRFAPDLLVVFDVEAHRRDKWLVSHEGKGLDWVLEVHVSGDRKKDADYNVRRYAQLGIPEYFMLDGQKQVLSGYRLEGPGASQYVRMKAEGGRYTSEVLGLEVGLEGERLCFFAGKERLLEWEEWVQRAEQRGRKVKEERRRRQEAERRLTEEARLREEAERRVAELHAELARLQGRNG